MTVFTGTQTTLAMPDSASGTISRFYGSLDGHYHFIDFDDGLEIIGSVRADLGEERWMEGVWMSELMQVMR